MAESLGLIELSELMWMNEHDVSNDDIWNCWYVNETATSNEQSIPLFALSNELKNFWCKNRVFKRMLQKVKKSSIKLNTKCKICHF